MSPQRSWPWERSMPRPRCAAGPNQHDFAKLVFTSRSSIANIERGRPVSTRDFWERCDAVFGTGRTSYPATRNDVNWSE
jgi:Helix-turn-helix domain